MARGSTRRTGSSRPVRQDVLTRRRKKGTAAICFPGAERPRQIATSFEEGPRERLWRPSLMTTEQRSPNLLRDARLGFTAYKTAQFGTLGDGNSRSALGTGWRAGAEQRGRHPPTRTTAGSFMGARRCEARHAAIFFPQKHPWGCPGLLSRGLFKGTWAHSANGQPVL